MADSRLSECISALLRHSHGIAQAGDEMAYYGVLSDFAEGGFFRRAKEKRFEIIESYGFTWDSLWSEIADRCGLEVVFGESNWTGEQTILSVKGAPTSFHVGRHAYWFEQAIPWGSPEDERVGEMLAHTP